MSFAKSFAIRRAVPAARRHRRSHAATGVGCVSLSALLLAACTSAPPVRPVAADVPRIAPTPVVAPAPALPREVSTEIPTDSPWPRLRARYALPACDHDPAVQSLARQMAAQPALLGSAFKRAMPFVLVVTEEIERLGLPGEFAFLPWVESNYAMLPAASDGSAGMWQLMSITARENGLRVDADYDGRLDVAASSRAALSLLKRYNEQFGDWRLANMAYNAGENALKTALGTRRDLSAKDIAQLKLGRTNYAHLTKLLAISCVIAEPERYHVDLPEPDPRDMPALVELPAPVDLRLAAAAAGMSMEQMRRWNPAYLKTRMPERGPYRLLVPAAQRAAMLDALDSLPRFAWREWHEYRLQRPQSIDTLSMAWQVDAQALAAINHAEPGATLPAGSRLLLPGRAVDSSPSTAQANQAIASVEAVGGTPPQFCTVRPGDTLWDIARHYGVRLDDLQSWNRLSHDAILHQGQKLLLAPR